MVISLGSAGFAGSAGSAVPRSAVPQISATPGPEVFVCNSSGNCRVNICWTVACDIRPLMSMHVILFIYFLFVCFLRKKNYFRPPPKKKKKN